MLALQVLDLMLKFYTETPGKRKKKSFSSYPGIGLLNVAVSCALCYFRFFGSCTWQILSLVCSDFIFP